MLVIRHPGDERANFDIFAATSDYHTVRRVPNLFLLIILAAGATFERRSEFDSLVRMEQQLVSKVSPPPGIEIFIAM